MSILWLLYAIIVGAAFAGAAHALEQVLAHWRWPRRGVWAVALGAAVITPVVAARRASSAVATANTAPVDHRAPTTTVVPLSWLSDLGAKLSARARHVETLRVPAVMSWAAVSCLLAAGYLGAAGALVRRRRRWTEGTVSGIDVLIADDDSGPAVVGIVRPRIVLPVWALRLDASPRALMLAHEAEHVRARDPLLLTTAVMLVIAMPWNLAVWWIVRRLRLAVEIDCDARVLRQTRDPFAYARLLVDVGTRRARSLPVASPALLERRTALEQRITAMHQTRPRHPLLRTTILATMAIAAVVVACGTPRPEPLAPPSDDVSTRLVDASAGPQTMAQIRSLVAQRVALAPPGDSGEVLAVIVQDASGRVVISKLSTLAKGQGLRTPAPDGAPRKVVGEGAETSSEFHMTGTLDRSARLYKKRRSGTPPSMSDDVLAGLDVESIDAIEIVKSRASETVPKPVSIIVVRLKEGVRLPPTPALRVAR